MKLKIAKKDCHLRLLKIPKDYRVIEDWELCLEVRTNETLKKIATDGWIFVNTIKGIKMAGFSYDSSGFHVDSNVSTYYDPSCSRGVFVKKEEKKENSGWAKRMIKGGRRNQ